jgi:hypothetical protein
MATVLVPPHAVEPLSARATDGTSSDNDDEHDEYDEHHPDDGELNEGLPCGTHDQ